MAGLRFHLADGQALASQIALDHHAIVDQDDRPPLPSATIRTAFQLSAPATARWSWDLLIFERPSMSSFLASL